MDCLCGREMEGVRSELVRFAFSGREEIVGIFECKVCDRMFSHRGDGYELEDYE